MQTVFGISAKAIEEVQPFLSKASSLSQESYTYSKSNIGYGLETIPRASFERPLASEELQVLLVGDFIDKDKVANDLSGMDFTSCRDKVEASIDQIRGTFCIILIDFRAGRICIFSDRHGIIPIYYYCENGVFVFATSLKCVLCCPEVPRTFNREILYELFKLEFIIPPSTIIDNVHMLSPGEVLDFSPGCVKKSFRSKPNKVIDSQMDIDAAAEIYYRRLKKSISDCTTGKECSLLLSGGIDSGAIASILARLGIRPQCFTIDLGSDPVELMSSKKVSQLFDLPHQVITSVDVDDSDMVEHFSEVAWVNESPTCVGITEYILCKTIQGEVVLTGDGNDLAWGIYPDPPSRIPITDLYLWMRTRVSDDLLSACLAEPMQTQHMRDKIRSCYADTGDLPTDLSRLDTRLFGNHVSNDIGKIEIGASSCLFRFPYLDISLQRMISEMPNSFKSLKTKNDTFLKYLFRHALEKKKILPHSMIYDTKTWISPPNAAWLRGGLRNVFEETVFHKDAFSRNHFDIDYVKNLWSLHLESDVPQVGKFLPYFFTMLFMLELWSAKFSIQ